MLKTTGISLQRALQKSQRQFNTFTTTKRSITKMSSAPALISGPVFWLDTFALRQWDDPNFSGTRMACSKEDFVQKVHDLHASGAAPLVDGYAPFCKHLFIPNEWGATVGALPITEDNRNLLQTGYTKRRPEELAVLNRWFPAEKVTPHVGAYIDVILYSREQLIKEYEALPHGKAQHTELPNAEWGIISLKAQDEPHETPMQPITMMRNALGREEGGSGVAIDREKYAASVDYWEKHAPIQ